MAITINGTGTISGISAGGLPDGCITADDIASDAISSTALKKDFTVATGETVTAGDVVNFINSKIGENPVVNSQSSVQIDSTYDVDFFNASGTVAVRAETNGNGYHQVRTGTVNSTTGAITWAASATDLHTGNTDLNTNLVFLDDNKFLMWGRSNSSYSGDQSNMYFVCFSVNESTGAVTKSNAYVLTSSNVVYNYSNFKGVIKGLSTPKFFFRRHSQEPNNVHTGTEWMITFTDSGNLTFSNTNSGTIETNYDDTPKTGTYLFNSDTQALQARGDTYTWQLYDYNGTLSNKSDIEFDTSYSSDLRIYRISGQDKFLAVFKNTSNEIKLNTYSFASSTITKENDHTIISSGAGVTIGDITGTGNNIVLGYEDDSKGYVATYTIDSSTYAVNGTGLAVLHNSSNVGTEVSGPHNTNKYTAWINTGGKVHSRVLTVNAYATSSLNWLGIAEASASGGNTCSVILDGVASGFTGLTVGTKYYYDTSVYDGSVTATATEYLIGTAVSATEIKING